jgi:hypothetical protein
MGPGFVAEGYDVSLTKGVEILASGAEFFGCKIISGSRKSSNMQRACIERCTFEGTFHAWKLGGRGRRPSVVSCDFDDADLDYTEFFDCNVREQKFHGWPTMVFVQLDEHKEAIRRTKWPDTFRARTWLEMLLEYPSDGFVVNESLATRLGIELPELRKIAKSLGDAVMM